MIMSTQFLFIISRKEITTGTCTDVYSSCFQKLSKLDFLIWITSNGLALIIFRQTKVALCGERYVHRNFLKEIRRNYEVLVLDTITRVNIRN